MKTIVWASFVAMVLPLLAPAPADAWQVRRSYEITPRVRRAPPVRRSTIQPQKIPLECTWTENVRDPSTEGEWCKYEIDGRRTDWTSTGRTRKRSAQDMEASRIQRAEYDRRVEERRIRDAEYNRVGRSGCEADFDTRTFTNKGGAPLTLLDDPSVLNGKSFIFRGPGGSNYAAEPADILGVVVAPGTLTVMRLNRQIVYKTTGQGLDDQCYSNGTSCLKIARSNEDETAYVLIEKSDHRQCDYRVYGFLLDTPAKDYAAHVSGGVSKQAARDKAQAQARASNTAVPELVGAYKDLDRINAIYTAPATRATRQDFRDVVYTTVYVGEYDRRCGAGMKSYKTYIQTRDAFVKTQTTYGFRSVTTTNYYERVIDRVIKVKPELYSAFSSSVPSTFQYAIREWNDSGRDITLTDLLYLVSQSLVTAQADITTLLDREGCSSPTLTRFENSLARMAAP